VSDQPWPPPGGPSAPAGEPSPAEPTTAAEPTVAGRGPDTPSSTPSPPPGRSARSLIWLLGLVVVGVLAFRTHRITTDDVIIFLVIIPSIILHEIAHGWVALAFGDDTAKRAGRLTLNPVAHIDPVGTLLVPGLLILAGFGWFGWAKPVPVNLGRLRSPRNQGLLVALAGPAMNLVLVGLAALAFHLTGAVHQAGLPVWVRVLYYLGLVNIWLAVFNLIPIPPLDGSAVIERALPAAWWPGYLRVRQYSLPILIGAFLLLANAHIHGASPLARLADDTQRWWLQLLGVT